MYNYSQTLSGGIAGYSSVPAIVCVSSTDIMGFSMSPEARRLRAMPPAWLHCAVRPKIASLLSLLDDWDSYGAARIEAPAARAANNLMDLIALLPNIGAPTVGATPDGEIELSWQHRGTCLDVLVPPGGAPTYSLIDTSGRIFRSGHLRDASVFSSLSDSDELNIND